MKGLDGASILWWDIVGALRLAGYETTEGRVKLVRQVSDEENCRYLGGRIYGIIKEIALRERWPKLVDVVEGQL